MIKQLQCYILPILLVFIFANLKLDAQSQLTISITDTTAISCTNDGAATVEVTGGTAPYTVYWIQYNQGPAPGPNGPDTVAVGLSVTGLSGGYYSIVAVDASQPALIGYSGIYIQPAFQVYQFSTPATCSNADGMLGIVMNGAEGPFDIEWSTGQIHTNVSGNRDSIFNVAAGNYTATVTDQATGCFVGAGGGSGTSGEGLYIFATSPVTATSTATPSNCFDGTATVVPANGTAPYTYLWNTSPAQSNATATGLSPGFISCLITDAEGCTRTQFVNVPAGPNYLQVSSTVSNSQCGSASGFINVSVTGGVQPYSYNWSNGSITEDISGLSPGSYNLVVTDAQGCELSVFKYVQNSSPVQVSLSGTFTGCNQGGGFVTSTVTNGTAPFTYQWNNGGNTDAITGLNTGFYSVQVTDAAGCTGYAYTQLNLDQACYVNITGRVFNDLNGNCVQDAGESALPNVLVNAGPGYHYATTNSQGAYSISALPGDYEIQVYSPNNWTQICPEAPQTISVSANTPGQTYGSNNFYLQPDSVFNDISVSVASGPVRPGFPVHWYAVVRNLGTTTLTPVLELEHDALATFTGANPPVTSYNAASHTASWNVAPMPPLSSRNYYLYTVMSTSAVLGDSARATGIVSLSADANEVDFENNTDMYARLITGSYDPNDKAVQPQGFSEQGYILPDETNLFYRVRFQNTGTDTAFTVVIRDTLDPALDVPSFRVHESSHPMQYEIDGEGYLTFTFNNILLPDSFINEPASHGLVSYYIDLKENTAPLTEIRNTAAIYFDFNAPIYTNTTLNTVFDITTGQESMPGMQAVVLPNPSAGSSLLQVQMPQAGSLNLVITDLSGRTVLQRQFGTVASGEHLIPLDNLSTGVYLVNVSAGDTFRSVKLVVGR